MKDLVKSLVSTVSKKESNKFLKILFKVIGTLVLIVLFAILATSLSLVYDFEEAKPFSGPDIFNPYKNIDPTTCWKRANFHTHTKVEGIFNECDYWPSEVLEAYKKLGYDIVTFSNHNQLTVHPNDSLLQVDVYEHGYNLSKYHKLVFGCDKVNYFDHLLPVFVFQKQFQLDMLNEDADFIVLNHPLRTSGLSKPTMEKLSGYRMIELDSGKSTENEYWDWALSAGHYSFGMANDDLHHPDRTSRIARRCNFLSCSTGKYEDIKETLLSGGYYSMRIPDFGHGNWDEKYAKNRNLASITDIGLNDDTIYISLSAMADSIKIVGQNHKTLAKVTNSGATSYVLPANEPYARITAYFQTGEVIYTNPFARYDSSISESPFRAPHSVNIPLTILYNSIILILCAAVIILSKTVILR